MLYAIGRLRLLPRPLPSWAAALVVFLCYALLAGGSLLYLEHIATLSEYFFPLPWLADGVAVSLMLLWGTRTWPGVLLGSIFVWGVLRGDPAVTVGVDAIGEALSVVLTVTILRAWRFRRQFDRLADPLILVVAALAGRLVAVLADLGGTVVAVWLTPHSLPPEFARIAIQPGTLMPTAALVWALARWQVTVLTGIVLAVPALLSSPRKLWYALRTRPLRVACLSILSACWVFGALALSATWSCWPLLLAAVLLVAWAAMEFGALTAALCTLLFACTAGVAFCQGVGPLPRADVLGGLAATWGFIGLLCCVSPVLTVVLSARQHQDRRLAVLGNRYRSLFTANPTPAWVADAASGMILMANAEAIRRYGYAESEFLRMKISELCADRPGDTQPPPPDADLVAAPLAKHLTRDGRVIDVELVLTPLELDGRAVNLVHAVDMTDHQELRRRLLATVDGESFRIAKELHDDLGQVLAGLSIGSEALLQRTERLAQFDSSSTAQMCELANHAQQAESRLFRLTSGVSPVDGLHREESLANALKYSPADRIVIRAVIDQERIRVSVAGNGLGLKEDSVGSGLAGLTYLGRAALIVLACWIGGAISHVVAVAHSATFNYADARLAVPSLMAGAAVCGLQLGGLRQWPAVFLGIFLVRFGQIGEPSLTALVLSAISVAGCYALVAVLRRWSFTASLDRWQDPLMLCAATGVAWALVNALGFLVMIPLTALGARMAPGVAALYSSSAPDLGIHMTWALFCAEIRWWWDVLAGTVLLVPTLTLPAALRRACKESLSELFAWCVCLAGWALLLLAVSTDKLLLPLLTLSILLVVWAAARLGVAFASLATLAFAMVAATSFSTRMGALATLDAASGVAYVWGMVGVHTVIGLFLAALLAEHHSRHRELTAVNKRYRCLFQGDPRPLWLHDVRTGQILEANEPAARAYGYSMAEFTALHVTRLLAPGTPVDVLGAPGDRAVGPLAMKHVKKNGSSLDVEIWSYGTFLDGRRVSICFAHDVTERNTLRRLLFDRAELERRQLAEELRRRLAGPLAELRIVAHKLLLELRRTAAPARMRELLQSLARQAGRSAERCREAADRLSPLQANCGNLLAALEALQRQIPNGAPLEISVVGETPLALEQQQAEKLYSLLSEILTRCLAGRRGNVHLTIRTFERTVRVAVDAPLESPAEDPAASLARHPSVLLRARAMGARLWERALGASHMRLVCDYSL